MYALSSKVTRRMRVSARHTTQRPRCTHVLGHAHRPARRTTRVHLSRRDYGDSEGDVRLDGEEDERQRMQPSSSQGVFSALTGQAMSLFNFAAAKLTDATLAFAPDGTSVVVVERAVKLGMVLALLALVRSFLSVVLTLGSVALAIYVATRVFGVQVSDGYSASSSTGAEPRRQDSRRGRGGRGPPRRRDAKQDDVIDVWYD